MKTILAVAAVVALVAVAAWALTSSKPAGPSYVVEVRDVAGAKSFVVSPEVGVTASRPALMTEVVARANLMPEVVVRATALPEFAGLGESGSEVLN